MLSYFFIPANKLENIEFIKSLGVDEIIIDFEDAILETDQPKFLSSLHTIVGMHQFWFRIPLKNSQTGDKLELGLFLEVLRLGARKIVLPKLSSREEFAAIVQKIDKIHDCKFILLIEHPRMLAELGLILQDQKLSKFITGIGLGSHDLMTAINSEHSEAQLYYPRMQVLYLSKGYNKLAIDIASMSISNEGNFNSELLFGYQYGFDAKFLIHPNQSTWFGNYDQYKVSQLNWAKKILANLPTENKGKEIEPFVIDGVVVEKAHVEKALNIIKQFKNEN